VGHHSRGGTRRRELTTQEKQVMRPVLSSNAWYERLGVTHRQRDEAASRDASTLATRDQERHAALRRRWPTLAAATRALSHDYNQGAGGDALTVVDDASDGDRDLALQVVARGGQRLTLTLVGAELCVRATPGTVGAADDGRRWIAIGPSDEATVAYALQHWLTQL
jgi:hypothetical protein